MECCSVMSPAPLKAEVFSLVSRTPRCPAGVCGIGLPSRYGLPATPGPQFLMCSHHSVTWVFPILQLDCSNFIDFHPQVPFLTNKRLHLGVGEIFPRAPDIWAIHTISRKACTHLPLHLCPSPPTTVGI